MGRRCTGDTIVRRKLDPVVHVPGRRILLGADYAATILYATKKRAVVFMHPQGEALPEGRIVGASSRDMIMFANDIPRRWKRPEDGYWCIYLGRGHPLAYSAGWQYEHRLIAFGKTGRLSGFTCSLTDQDASRSPAAVTTSMDDMGRNKRR